MAAYSGRVRVLSDLFEEEDFAVGWAVRPTLLCGYQRHNWALGAELSYGALGIDFTDEASGTHEEVYLGLFLRASQ